MPESTGTARSSRTVFVCAHGAGGHKDDSAMRRVARILAPLGVDLERFNFPYRERGSKRIDPMPVLTAAFLERIRPSFLIGGRSMGGRVASMLAAEGVACRGLLLFAYPLHPAGNPEKLRVAHLPAIRCPVLCFNGTRDALCTRELMEQALRSVSAPWTMHWIEGADHSFRVLRSSGRTEAQVDAEIGEAAARWLASLGQGTRDQQQNDAGETT
jgi:predicted alpha/beta-hydrolase family hydrolase